MKKFNKNVELIVNSMAIGRSQRFNDANFKIKAFNLKSNTRHVGHIISAKVKNTKNSRYGWKRIVKVFLRAFEYYKHENIIIVIFEMLQGERFNMAYNLNNTYEFMQFCQIMGMIEGIAPLYDLVEKDLRLYSPKANESCSILNREVPDVVRFKYQLTCEYDKEAQLVISIKAPRILERLR